MMAISDRKLKANCSWLVPFKGPQCLDCLQINGPSHRCDPERISARIEDLDKEAQRLRHKLVGLMKFT